MSRRKQRKQATAAYTGPRHQEQYLVALLKLRDAGMFAPGTLSVVDVIHDEADDGRVVELVIRNLDDGAREHGE
jgi:uncharacterized OB-fold protein